MEIGPIMTNCYLLLNDDDEKVIIVDPGGEASAVIHRLEQYPKYTPVAILLTHGHFDHILGVEELRKKYNIPVYAHEDEKETLHTPEFNMGSDMGEGLCIDADHYVRDGEELELGGFKIKCLHTPGHTPGGVCFYLAEEKIVFSGDSLFNQSIGRTDFPNGSASQLVRSVADKLFTLPDDVKVLPGHEQLTTIGFEKQYNPFF